MTPLPFLTADLPGCGGQLKLQPSDFEVEEVPAYAPSGEGEHLFLWVEKVGHDTQWVARELGKALGIDPREVGYAGMKDRRAVTRQLFSVPARLEPNVQALAIPEVRVLWTRRHGNKLRTGHLKGNKFVLTLRGVQDGEAARAVATRLEQLGAPNYFGEQRFGRAGDNAELGVKLLKGERLPKRPDRFQRKLFLSSAQSALFNDVVRERLQRGLFAKALVGDVLRKHDTGGAFRCESPETDQPRVDRLEVSPTGPMFGPKMMEPAGEPRALELEVLTAAGLTESDFIRGGDETQGARRSIRIPLEFERFELSGSDLTVAFELPKGSYATVVMRELMKNEPGADLDSDA